MPAPADQIVPERIDVSAHRDSPTPTRIESIDLFRGLNVLVMIFVDNLGLVKGLPWWTYHMPENANGMTYVDMVFPAFLFLMGMSIPLSTRAQFAKGQSQLQIWWHVGARSLSLVALGLFVANAPLVDARSTGMSPGLWATLGFVAIALGWLRLPVSDRHKRVLRGLRFAGFALLVVLTAIFRRATTDGHIAWLDFSDWEILGLLGWAYLLVSAIYLVCRKQSTAKKRFAALALAFVVLVAINVLSTAGRSSWLQPWQPYLQPFEAGLSSMTVAGVLASLLIVENDIAVSLRKKAQSTLGIAASLFAAGWLLRPLGMSKIRDTPSWCLYCISANFVIALLLYWLADVKQWGGAKFARIVGANPLLAYFLPYTAYLIPKLGWLTADGTTGWTGVAWSAGFTSLILVAVLFLNRWKIQLRI
jgi:heparan-alpha-glucosaminide N-acetyltransferase